MRGQHVDDDDDELRRPFFTLLPSAFNQPQLPQKRTVIHVKRDICMDSVTSDQFPFAVLT